MTEHQIQSAFIDWVRLAEKQDDRLSLLFAVPNGGKRDGFAAFNLKKEGVKAGVPDIIFPLKTDAFNGLAIEFKRPKNSRTSEAQKDYMALLEKYGWCVVKKCTDAETAIRIVKDYLGSVLVRVSYISLENK
jgi:hypothetical protein